MTTPEWRRSETLAWTRRDGVTPPPAGVNRWFFGAIALSMAGVWIGMLATDTLCPEHRMWVQTLGVVASFSAVSSIFGLVGQRFWAPLAALASRAARDRRRFHRCRPQPDPRCPHLHRVRGRVGCGARGVGPPTAVGAVVPPRLCRAARRAGRAPRRPGVLATGRAFCRPSAGAGHGAGGTRRYIRTDVRLDAALVLASEPGAQLGVTRKHVRPVAHRGRPVAARRSSIVVIVVQRDDRAERSRCCAPGRAPRRRSCRSTMTRCMSNTTTSASGAVTAPLRDDELEVGERVNVVYDRDDPYRVLLDLRPTTTGPSWSSSSALALLGSGCDDRRLAVDHAARRRRLATKESTAFRMLAVDPPRQVVRRPASLAVPVGLRGSAIARCARSGWPTSRTHVPGGRCDEVEVKGASPSGRAACVVRREDVVLWPRGRALVSEGQQRLATNASQATPIAPPTRVSSTDLTWRPTVSDRRRSLTRFVARPALVRGRWCG